MSKNKRKNYAFYIIQVEVYTKSNNFGHPNGVKSEYFPPPKVNNCF